MWEPNWASGRLLCYHCYTLSHSMRHTFLSCLFQLPGRFIYKWTPFVVFEFGSCAIPVYLKMSIWSSNEHAIVWLYSFYRCMLEVKLNTIAFTGKWFRQSLSEVLSPWIIKYLTYFTTKIYTNSLIFFEFHELERVNAPSTLNILPFASYFESKSKPEGKFGIYHWYSFPSPSNVLL